VRKTFAAISVAFLIVKIIISSIAPEIRTWSCLLEGPFVVLKSQRLGTLYLLFPNIFYFPKSCLLLEADGAVYNRVEDSRDRALSI
jgi:hypothetical protein